MVVVPNSSPRIVVVVSAPFNCARISKLFLPLEPDITFDISVAGDTVVAIS